MYRHRDSSAPVGRPITPQILDKLQYKHGRGSAAAKPRPTISKPLPPNPPPDPLPECRSIPTHHRHQTDATEKPPPPSSTSNERLKAAMWMGTATKRVGLGRHLDHGHSSPKQVLPSRIPGPGITFYDKVTGTPKRPVGSPNPILPHIPQSRSSPPDEPSPTTPASLAMIKNSSRFTEQSTANAFDGKSHVQSLDQSGATANVHKLNSTLPSSSQTSGGVLGTPATQLPIFKEQYARLTPDVADCTLTKQPSTGRKPVDNPFLSRDTKGQLPTIAKSKALDIDLTKPLYGKGQLVDIGLNVKTLPGAKAADKTSRLIQPRNTRTSELRATLPGIYVKEISLPTNASTTKTSDDHGEVDNGVFSLPRPETIARTPRGRRQLTPTLLSSTVQRLPSTPVTRASVDRQSKLFELRSTNDASALALNLCHINDIGMSYAPTQGLLPSNLDHPVETLLIRETEPHNRDIDEKQKDMHVSTHCLSIEHGEETQFIESSLRHCVQLERSQNSVCSIRRLSTTAPEHGPTLRIYGSAERLIMGKCSDHESSNENTESNAITLKFSQQTAAQVPLGDNDVDDVLVTHDLNSNQGHWTIRNVIGDFESESPRQKRTRSIAESTITCDDADGAVEPIITANVPLVSSQPTGTSNIMVHEHLQRLRNNSTIDEAAWISPAKDRRVSGAKGEPHIQGTNRSQSGSTTGDSACLIPTRPGRSHELKRSTNHKDIESIIPTFDDLESEVRARTHVTAGEGSPDSFPARSSSHATAPDFTVDLVSDTTEMRSGAPHRVHDDNLSQISPVSPLSEKGGKYLSNALYRSYYWSDQELPVSSGDHTSHQFEYSPAGHDTTTEEGNQDSLTRGMFKSVRDIFHRHHNSKTKRKAPTKPTVKIATPYKYAISGVKAVAPPTLNSSYTMRPPRRFMTKSSVTAAIPDVLTPNAASRLANLNGEIAEITALTLDVLDRSRKESDKKKRNELLEIGKALVNAISQARDTYKASEEAKVAAKKAELSHTMCLKSIEEITTKIKVWRNKTENDGSCITPTR